MGGKRSASSTSGGASKRTLRKTLSEEDASKKCRDNLKGYSDEQVYVVKNAEGTTAFDEVLAGVRASVRSFTSRFVSGTQKSFLTRHCS